MAGDVMVRADQQCCWVRERSVLLDDGGFNMAVRGDDGQVLNTLKRGPRDAAHPGICGREPIRVCCKGP